MELRDFGNTGLRVTPVSLGAGQVGYSGMDEAAAEQLLNGVLDAGVRLIDTARSYGPSEERIGRYLAHRRSEFILSSKCGYGVSGVADWSGAAVARGIDEALRRLASDCIDIMHLHSCALQILEQDDVIRALEDARAAGKIRCAAYSGENEALQFAVRCGRFDSIQTSVNLVDQRSLRDALPQAAARGLGVIAKRPLANAFWRFAQRPVGEYAEEYWQRAAALQLTSGALAWDEFAARFAAFAPGVSTIIVGTTSLAHFRAVQRAVAAGPLPAQAQQAVLDAFAAHGAAWPGQV